VLSPTGELVAAARSRGGAVGAFNVVTLEHAEAIVAGAERAGLPVILQVSENTVRFHGALAPLAAAAHAAAELAAVPVALHLDHVTGEELLAQALPCGFSSVMYDASRRPYAANLAATRAAARRCRDWGLWLESELGEVGGKNGAHAPGARTDPAQAADYVAATGVDALAVAIGSEHAMTTRSASLDHDLLARLAAAVPVPLVLHGSSGVPDGELAAGVRGGLAKINIGTALNVAYLAAFRDGLPAGPDPRPVLAAARENIAATVAHHLRLLADPAALPQS
jgi:fructose-bisphosphate aldolase, class II